uniref:Uncharacterized protein n=1 Tax=Dunaliella tertiolecta TaxID=3047 RepID=A0A7S3VNA5_DUNTE
MTQSHLLEALQQTSQRLAADLVDKTNQIDLLNSKLRTFNEDHAEEVQASRFQVMEQDKVIKALQAEVQQLRSRLSPLRRDFACQPPPAPAPLHFACQAVPTTAEAALQAQPDPGCNVASQTEPTDTSGAAVGVGMGDGAALGELNEGGRGLAVVNSQGTQTEVAAAGAQGGEGPGMSMGAKWRSAADAAQAAGGLGAPKGSSSDAHKVEASDAHPSSDTLAFDLQVLTKKYERAINQKVEAEEASLQAQLDVAQLIKLCEFYKSKAEAAVQASAAAAAAAAETNTAFAY